MMPENEDQQPKDPWEIGESPDITEGDPKLSSVGDKAAGTPESLPELPELPEPTVPDEPEPPELPEIAVTEPKLEDVEKPPEPDPTIGFDFEKEILGDKPQRTWGLPDEDPFEELQRQGPPGGEGFGEGIERTNELLERLIEIGEELIDKIEGLGTYTE